MSKIPVTFASPLKLSDLAVPENESPADEQSL
jgi:hypothetical protein